MSDHLRAVAERLLGRLPVIEPRLPGLFERGGPAGTSIDDATIEDAGDDGPVRTGALVSAARRAESGDDRPSRTGDQRSRSSRLPAPESEPTRASGGTPVAPSDAPSATNRREPIREMPAPGREAAADVRPPPLPRTATHELTASPRTVDVPRGEHPERVVTRSVDASHASVMPVAPAPPATRPDRSEPEPARSDRRRWPDVDRIEPPRTPETAARASMVPHVSARLAEARPLQPAAPEREAAGPTIRVTIGRVELRAAQTSAPPPAARPQPHTMSLEEYLRRRRSGEA